MRRRGAIAPSIEQAEIARAIRKPTSNFDAYDYFLRGMANLYKSTKAALKSRFKITSKAIELDPIFAAPYGWAAIAYTKRKQALWMSIPERRLRKEYALPAKR